MKRFNMSVNGVDEISVEEKDQEYFKFCSLLHLPDEVESVELLLTRDELVELKVRIDMLLEFTK